MKTRYKILIGVLVIVSLYAGIVELDNQINGNLHQTSIHESTGNPNECWYQDDDGNITPCRMGPDVDVIGMFLILFWPYIILGIVIVIIFIVWRKRK